MRSLLLLTLAFTLLVAYCETVLRPGTSHAYLAANHQIVRTTQPAIEPASPAEPAVAVTINNPQTEPNLPLLLNLDIPHSPKPFKFNTLLPKRSALKLRKAAKKPTVSYNAELVYDIEKGENITGGKVNITIPFG